MADRASIAIRQEQALNRLRSAADKLSASRGVSAPDIPTRGNDAEMLRALQFEAFAAWLESMIVHVPDMNATRDMDGDTTANAPTSLYDGMSKADLVLELRNRGMDITDIKGTGSGGNVIVPDLIAALEANDEQATADAED